MVKFAVPYFWKLLIRRVSAFHHKWTYHASPSARNIVVIGGSFSGVHLGKRLSETVPTGHRVIVVERNSHLYYLFNFPRFSVIPGYEKQAFIPYDGLIKCAPPGALQFIQDTVTHIRKDCIQLASGGQIPFAYLAIATGSKQNFPENITASESREACNELRQIQKKIQAARRIAVIGGGALGVEISADIKSFFPQKIVTLFHSRDRLLHQFGPKLHGFVIAALQKMGIRIVLRQRPRVLPERNCLEWSSHREEFDLVIPCTGQTPNSTIVTGFAPASVSQETQRVLVKPSLQLQDARFPNVFALGDVAETHGPKMARAGYFQAEIVSENILNMIRGNAPNKLYRPMMEVEGAIRLSLGKNAWVLHVPGSDRDLLVSGDDGKLDLGINEGWNMMRVKMEDGK
ncbi:hypothetical protein N7478_001477 [Penicillium angulare]|uniref:uncharacterized protein n=1 Tax=Penicillium angulare TaxID=116970 RepID=UPI0025424893|nr:uncharacterized protein N7478_001477 [Penicillium angulare]KAJ5292226.1 hypothetical protein N7478_001477 [Penicillium angulare]